MHWKEIKIQVTKYIQILLQLPVAYDISPLSRVEKYRNPHGQLKENLFLPLFTDLLINYRFDNMRRKVRDIFPPLVQRG